MAFGQCGLGQDPRAHRPGGAAAARRHRSAEHPVPDLHQGRGQRDAEPPVPAAWRMGDDGGCQPARRAGAARHAAGDHAALGPHAVRPRDRDAGGPAHPDDPLVLRGALAALSARGRGQPAVHRDGGPHRAASARRGGRRDGLGAGAIARGCAGVSGPRGRFRRSAARDHRAARGVSGRARRRGAGEVFRPARRADAGPVLRRLSRSG